MSSAKSPSRLPASMNGRSGPSGRRLSANSSADANDSSAGAGDNRQAAQTMSSCFVHAYLDKGVQEATPGGSTAIGSNATTIGGSSPRLSRTHSALSGLKAPPPPSSMGSSAGTVEGSQQVNGHGARVDAYNISRAMDGDLDVETPRINDWSKDVRRAYFPEIPVIQENGADQVKRRPSQDMTRSLSSVAAPESKTTPDGLRKMLRSKSTDEHSGSEGTVIREAASQKASSGVDDGSAPSGFKPTQPFDKDDEDSENYSDSSSFILSSGEEDSDDRVRSLTRQLAETAVGVREMSKQLGRARVKSTIQSVLIITKARDNHLIKLTRDLAIWLMTTPRNGLDRGLIVYVDSQLKNSKRFDAQGIEKEFPGICHPVGDHSAAKPRSASVVSVASNTTNMSDTTTNGFGKNEGQLRYWTAEMCSRTPQHFDFVATLGGDGTVLFASWLFQRIVPPVLPFALGSLGFLTNFNFENYQNVMTSALDDGIRVNLRMRFTATVYRAVVPTSETVDEDRRRAIKSGRTGEILMRNIQEGGWDTIETPCGGDPDSQTGRCAKRDKEVMCFPTRPVETFEVLNDLVVDRGPSPYVSLLEIFGDEHHMTTAQADGICISTPTGSTAYSLAAGGSLAHPEIPAILITPICPHTLSFRPMLLPDSMEVRIVVPYNSRSSAWASFDGRGRVELKQGDHIKVSASKYPFPTVCAENQSIDWFQSISRTLKWNERQRQKSFVIVEEDDIAEGNSNRRGSAQGKLVEGNHGESAATGQDAKPIGTISKLEKSRQNSSSDEDEDEGKFDIEDTSQANTRSNSPQSHGPKRRPSAHRRRNPSVLSSLSSLSGSAEADALPRLSAMAPNQFTASLSGSHSHAHRSASGKGRSSSEKAMVSSAAAPHASPDRFGKDGPPEPPGALSERHLASADFRLPPASMRGQQTQLPLQSESSYRVATNREGSAMSPASEAMGPLQAASEAVRSAANVLTPSAALARRTPRRKRTKENQATTGAADFSSAAAGRQATGFTADTADQQYGSGGGGGTALVVYGQDESESEDGIDYDDA